MNTLDQDTIMRYYVRRVAGHEQALDVWAQNTDLLLQIAAAYLRHNDIGHKKMNVPLVFLCDINCLEWTAGAQNGVTKTFYQYLCYQEQ